MYLYNIKMREADKLNGRGQPSIMNDDTMADYEMRCRADAIANYAEGTLDDIIQQKISKNVRNLKDFLGSNKLVTEKGDQNTNIISVGEKKTYYIPNTHLERFFGLLEECRKERRMLHYAERQETALIAQSGIMIDFDRYQQASERQFSKFHFESLAKAISLLLVEFIDFAEHADPNGRFFFRIFVISKPAVVLDKNGLYKDGFHVLIPELQVTKGLKKYLMQELIVRGCIAKIFRDIDHIEDPANMLDKMSASGPVHFVGNSKVTKPSYNLTHAYEMLIEDNIPERNNLDVDIINNGLNPHTSTPINLTYELALGAYFIALHGRPTWLAKRNYNYRSTLETKIRILVEKTSRDILDEDDIMNCESSVDILTLGNAEANYLKKLLEIIDISYATEYEKWFKVICAIAHTNTQYKELAIWFSHRRPESWSPQEIERVWREACARTNKNPVTKRSIIHWAKQSSPERFKEIDKENYFQILSRMMYESEGRVEHAMVARVCYSMIGDKFVADVGQSSRANHEDYCWYEFVTPGQAMRKGEIYKWRQEKEPDNMHLFISQHLPKVYLQLAANLKDRKENAQNPGEAKYWVNVEKSFRLFTSKLSNDVFQNGVIKQARYLFRMRGFFDDLDSYEDVLGVGNGVLKIGLAPKLIQGFHEYKISKYTETDYVPYDPDNEHIRVLLNAFRDIFPEEDVFEFMLYHASTGLDARESACLLLLLVGGGQNGKSFFAKMVHNTLGNMYCSSGKSALLTAPMERAESANSAQMQMRDKRYFYFDEFNRCEILNMGRVKTMVNPGWQSGRDLHQKQSNFKNTCNPAALSNFDFIIDTTDHGTWRRIYYYKNKVKFCARPNPHNKYEKKVDPRFMDYYTNDPFYLQAMLSILVHYYKKLCIHYGGDIKNIPVPTIAHETELFRNRQDTVNRFITEMIVRSPGSEELGIPTLANKYIEWFGINYKRGILPTGVEIQSQLENSKLAPMLTMGFGNKLCLQGYRVKFSPDEKIGDNESDLSCDITHERGEYKPPHTFTIDRPRPQQDQLIRDAPTHIQGTPRVSNEDSELENYLNSMI